MSKHLGTWLAWDAAAQKFKGARAAAAARPGPFKPLRSLAGSAAHLNPALRNRPRFARSYGLSLFPPPTHTNHTPAGKQVPGLGIYHEAFLVKAGQYEAVYRNMPRVGLARIGRIVDVSAAGARVCCLGVVGPQGGCLWDYKVLALRPDHDCFLQTYPSRRRPRAATAAARGGWARAMAATTRASTRAPASTHAHYIPC